MKLGFTGAAMAKSERFSWSQEMRFRMYAVLRHKFGTYSDWGKGPRGGDPRKPQGREAEYQGTLEDLAVEFGGDRAQWTALDQQVNWGVTRQVVIAHQGHFAAMVLNKVAAIQAGLLKNRDLPTNVSLAYEPEAATTDEAVE